MENEISARKRFVLIIYQNTDQSINSLLRAHVDTRRRICCIGSSESVKTGEKKKLNKMIFEFESSANGRNGVHNHRLLVKSELGNESAHTQRHISSTTNKHYASRGFHLSENLFIINFIASHFRSKFHGNRNVRSRNTHRHFSSSLFFCGAMFVTRMTQSTRAFICSQWPMEIRCVRVHEIHSIRKSKLANVECRATLESKHSLHVYVFFRWFDSSGARKILWITHWI